METLRQSGAEFAVCGGLAIDLFLARTTRPHGDIDIAVFWPERDRLIEYLDAQGYAAYEMLGGGKGHRITKLSEQFRVKRNIFCIREGCPLVTLYPTEEAGIEWVDFRHTGQSDDSYIELLFNDRTQDSFLYARDKRISLPLDEAILRRDGVPYLAPEMVLLYKSTDTGREGYGQDFRLAWEAMPEKRRDWLRAALAAIYPQGHPWRV